MSKTARLSGGALMLLAASLPAQETQTADEIAQELSNPVGSLASLVFQGTYTQWDGSAPGISDQNTSALIFMPTLPFKLAGGNLVVRPSFPFAGAPVPNSSGGWDKVSGFGDIVLLANWGKKTESGIIWSFGGTAIFPTASDPALGADQWQVGPAAILALLRRWGVVGAMWQHWWGLNTPEGGGAKANTGTLQLFYWFSMGGGWQVGGSPIPTANYVTATETDFTVPINLGAAKTFILGSMPLKATLQGQYFLTRPEVAGPSWGVFFQITPVVKVPW